MLAATVECGNLVDSASPCAFLDNVLGAYTFCSLPSLSAWSWLWMVVMLILLFMVICWFSWASIPCSVPAAPMICDVLIEWICDSGMFRFGLLLLGGFMLAELSLCSLLCKTEVLPGSPPWTVMVPPTFPRRLAPPLFAISAPNFFIALGSSIFCCWALA